MVVNEGDCIFDVGANIGLFTIFASQMQKNIQIYAFEPIASTFAVLEDNIRLHSLEKVRLFNCGLSSENNPDKIFTFYPNMAGNSTTKPNDIIADTDEIKSQPDAEEITDLFADLFVEQTQVKCQVRTLSSLIDELGIDTIDLLKIDVEGEEYEVLQGIEDKDWPKIKQIVGEFHDKKGRLEKVKTILTHQGFHIILEKRELLPSNFVDTYTLYAIR
uniref:FkbM family methyltransferase n=1 Tax=Nostoc sp. CMAA1605 TaxID=2055159 RepID=UPI002E328FE3|nr:FkbM family methyltransferase [Nostoc sp. CMAA1605]